MISGYEVGTEVKWNEDNTLTTGIIKDVYRASTTINVNSKKIMVEVNKDAPSYLIKRHTGDYLVLPHTALMLKSTNLHT